MAAAADSPSTMEAKEEPRKVVSPSLSISSSISIASGDSTLISRMFMHPDMPTNLTKNAPDFSAVYVISKGKAVVMRSAKGHVLNIVASPVKQLSLGSSQFHDPDDVKSLSQLPQCSMIPGLLLPYIEIADFRLG